MPVKPHAAHFETIGWFGAMLILAAHICISFRLIEVGPLYQAISITGATLLAWDAFFHRAKPAAWLNVVYATIALIALLRILTSALQ